MGRWTRNRLSVVVCLVLMVGAIGWTGWAYRIPPNERGDALVLPGFVLALVGVLVGVLPLVTRLEQRAARSVQALADRLAEAVDGQWRKEAHQRRLLPDPIPLRWSLSDLAVAGPLTAAVGLPGMPPAFPALPGHARSTETDLLAGGGRTELHTVYGGLASGRILVVGAPGAGKSGTAILLLLDALTQRGTFGTARRARVPVPVLLTAHGWDPTTTSVQDWLVDRLAATYPMFAHRGGRTEAADLVAARDQVALLLDGLDEMNTDLRTAALQALSDAPFRIVVFTRSQEMVRTAATTWLAGAVAVQLHDVTATEAAGYLQRAPTGPPPSGWAELLTHLREHPGGALARGLSTPLTLTLLRDTYQTGDDVGDLLQLAGSGPPGTLEQHLIARVLPAAYTPRPGRPAPHYTEQQARQALGFLARQMGPDRGLAWWHVARWTPALPRMLTTGLLLGLLFGILGGFLGGFVGGLRGGLLVGFVSGLLSGLLGGFLCGRGRHEPQRIRLTTWRAALSRRALRTVLVVGLVGGLVFGSLFWLAGGPLFGLLGVLAGGLVVGFLVRLTEGGTDEGSPLDPYEVLRNDRGVGLLVGLLSGLLSGLVGGLALSPLVGLVGGILGGLLMGLVYPEAWPATLAWRHLRWSGHVPAVRLMPFLEDARKRDVLRTVGAVYQFRHATLQDHLANHTTESPARGRASVQSWR